MITSVGVRQRGESVVLGGGSEKAFLSVCWSVFVLIGLSMVAVGTAVADRVTGGVVLAGSGWVLARLLRAEVVAHPNTLVIRGWWRRTLTWSEVAGADVVAANPATRLFGILRVQDGSGRRIKVDGIGYWMRSRDPATLPVGLMAAEINRRAGAPT